MNDWYEEDRVFRVRQSPVRYVDPREPHFSPRPRSRERIRPVVTHSPPAVVINNSVFNEHSDDEDDRARQLVIPVVRRRSRARSGSSSLMTREDVELEHTLAELNKLKLEVQTRKQENDFAFVKQKELEAEAKKKQYQTMKTELNEIKSKEEAKLAEDRLRKELELRRFQEAEKKAKANEERDQAISAALEKYKVNEIKRIALEEQQQKEAEEALKQRMHEQLMESGLSEAQVEAVLNKKKINVVEVAVTTAARPTYTRMARRYVSFETLRTFAMEFDVDPDNAEYILIKRWVPEAEQYSLWNHTRLIREKREKTLLIEKRPHRQPRNDEFEWVRHRPHRRSKSPGLLLYLAGAGR